MSPRQAASGIPIGSIAGIVLAGGLSRRLGGGDKALRRLGGRPLLAWVVERSAPQVAMLALNVNGEPDRFAAFGLPVIADGVPGFAGPLAGVLAGLDWAAARGYAWLASFAADTPFPPPDLVARLAVAATAAESPLALATSGGRPHPVFGLWSVALAAELRRALVEEGLRKVGLWASRHRPAYADFSTAGVDPFFNVNTPEDLAEAECLLAGLGATGRSP